MVCKCTLLPSNIDKEIKQLDNINRNVSPHPDSYMEGFSKNSGQLLLNFSKFLSNS